MASDIIVQKLLEIPEDGTSVSAIALVKGTGYAGQSAAFYNGNVSFYIEQSNPALQIDETAMDGQTQISLQLWEGNGFLNSSDINFACYELLTPDNDNISEMDPINSNVSPNFYDSSSKSYVINTTYGRSNFGMKFTINNTTQVEPGKLYVKFSCTKRESALSENLIKWGVLELIDGNGLYEVSFNWI